ncbi:MAG TPA: Ppx/GppA family phosphatase [Acidimicrobiia bacterium]|nr:Ppx/GppA family phosphatase [Acidimicrobiia bacterium]
MAPEIVPRWEWRTFGDRFERAEELLAQHTTVSVLESDELYFVSTNSNASVKVRDGLMDVKHLQQVNDDGLELWLPVMKASSPLSADETASVLTTLNVVVPPLEHADYTLDAIETELVRPNPELLSVPVFKHRSRYVIDECMVELTEVRAGTATTHTIALESPDPALVSATIRTFGLDGRRNVSVAPGLKTMLGFGARRYGVIDVGTNSVKFHLAERRADGELVTVVDRAEVTRLGEGLDESGHLAEEPIQRTVDAIANMVDEARRDDVVGIAAVGTAGLRSAPNRAELVDAVQARSGVTVEVISGEEEARLAYLAATSALPAARGRLVVFDSGGGSTQFTFGQGEQVDEQFSVDVGAVRVSERYGLASAVSTDTLDAAVAALAGDLDRLDGRPTPDAVVAIGGTATNLAAVKHGLAHYDADVVQGTVLDLDEIDRQIELYRTRDADERRQIVGLQPARAEVILAGACIVRTILTKLDHTSVTVSDRGLRHGVVLARFGR